MAKITNQYEELVKDHTTEEVLLYILAKLKESVHLSRIDPQKGETTKDLLMVSCTRSADAYFTLYALLKKLELLDDTPTVVA